MRTLAAFLVLVGFMALRHPAHADSVIDCSVNMEASGSFYSYYVTPPAAFPCTAPSGTSTIFSYVSPGGGGVAPSGSVRCEIPGTSDYDMDVDGNSDPNTECGTRVATPSNSVYVRSMASLGTVASWTHFTDSVYDPNDGNFQWWYWASHTHTTKFTVTHSRVYRLYGSQTPARNDYPTNGRKAEVIVQLQRWSGTDCTTPTYSYLLNPSPTPAGIALNSGTALPQGNYCLTVFGKIDGFPYGTPPQQGEYPLASPPTSSHGPQLDWNFTVQP